MAQTLSWVTWWRRGDSPEAAQAWQAAREAKRSREIEAALTRRAMEMDRVRWRTDLKPEPNI